MEDGPPRHRRSTRTLRRHLWLSGAVATLCFAGIAGIAGLASAFPATRTVFALPAPFWPGFVIALIASIFTANVLFQRMRAPLVRFLRCYESIAEGFVPAQIAIRSTDYLADEADALNAMIAALRRQQSVRREAVARLEEAIGDLAAQGTPESILSELQDVAKRLSVPSPRSAPGDGVLQGSR